LTQHQPMTYRFGETKMALIKCSECGNYVSGHAAACPKCGAPHALIRSASPIPVWLGMSVLAVLTAAVLGGLVFLSKRPGSSQRSVAATSPSSESSASNATPSEQPAVALVEQPGVSWADRADAVVTNILNRRGTAIATSIVRIIHPYDLPDRLRRFEVRHEGDGLSVLLKIGWEGDHGGGYHTTLVTWEFDQRQHRHAEASDNSGYSVTDPVRLDAYFRDELYPLIRQETAVP
jgi:hypothetical protein